MYITKTSNNARRIVKNASYLLIGQIFTGLSTLLLMVIVARKLGVDKFGIYTLALTIAGIFGVASDFGSSYLTIREVAKDKDKVGQYLVNGTIAKMALNIPFFLILFFFVRHFYNTELQLAIYLASFAIILKMFIQFYTSFFNAYEKMHLNTIVSSLQAALVFVVCLVILSVGFEKISYLFYGHIIVNSLVIAFSVVLLFVKISPKISRFDPTFSWTFFKKSIPFGFFFLGGVIYFQTDTVMLSVMKNETAVGYYQAVIRLVVTLEIIPGLLSAAMYPTFCRTYAHSKKESGNMMFNGLKYMLFLGLPMAVGLFFLSKEIILLFFGNKFMPSVLALQILAWIIPIRFCGHILGTILSASDNQTLRAMATGWSAFLNVGLNLLLIPRYGINGAAIASVVTSGFLVVYYYYSITKQICPVPLRKIIIPPLVPSIIMGFMVYIMRGLNVFVVVGLGMIVYIVSLVLMKGIDRDDYLMLKCIVLNRNNILTGTN